MNVVCGDGLQQRQTDIQASQHSLYRRLFEVRIDLCTSELSLCANGVRYVVLGCGGEQCGVAN